MPHSTSPCPPEDVLRPVGRTLQPPEREDELVVGGFLGRTAACLLTHGHAAPLEDEGRTPLAQVDGVRFLGHAGDVSSYHLPSGRYRLTTDLR